MFLLVPGFVFSQDWEIPEKIFFADMELQLSASVRRTLKTEVENIRRNEKYFQLKVDRANLYFPIIEKIFRIENFPEDFKYLALQESSLVSDAVSSSKAVGYWQFKKESAQEVGLRVDNVVDERMNIVASTRGAAKYIRKNNAVVKNWIYALLSYNLGLGGVKSKVEDRYVGAKKMKLDNSMHWYVIRFLAHKIAYENVVGKSSHPELKLLEYTDCSRKSLKQIAGETGLSVEELEDYNKWCIRGKVPEDKQYTVILPVRHNQHVVVNTEIPQPEKQEEPLKEKQPVKHEPIANTGTKSFFLNHNKLKAIKAGDGANFEDLALQGGISVDHFLLYNEVKKNEKPAVGQIYYLQPKRNKGLVGEHVVKPGETIWQIGQAYGMRSAAVRKKNRMKLKEQPAPGRVLVLRSKLKRGEKIRYTTPEPEITVAEPQDKKSELVPKPQPKPSNPPQAPAETVMPEQQPNTPVQDQENQGDQIHVVKAGETLYSISRLYNVTVEDLIRWNKLDDNTVKVGAPLAIGKQTQTAQPEFIEHEVKAGETMYSISRLYGVNVSDILELNGRKDYSLSVGEKLKIKQK